MKVFRRQIKNLDRAPLKIIFINGTILRVQMRDMIRWATEPTTFELVILAGVVFLIYFGYLGRADFLPEEVWQIGLSVLIFLVAFFFFVLLAVFLSFLVVRVQPNFILPMTLVIVMAHVANQIVAVELVRGWGVYVPDFALLYFRVIKIYILVLGLEIIYSAYMLPRSSLYRDRLYLSLGDTPSETPTTSLPASREPSHKAADPIKEMPAVTGDATPTPSEDLLEVGSHKFDQSSIRMIRAEQNYVRIFTKTGDFLVRAKMKDAVRGLCENLGIQAHRSCWVSFQNVLRTRSLPNGKLVMELNDGEEVIVPRARRKDVLQAIERSTPGSHQENPET